MTGHGALTVRREGPGRWVLWCECLEPIRASDPIGCHREHQDHVVAQELAERSGVECVAP
jgi:hypothetical protein